MKSFDIQADWYTDPAKQMYLPPVEQQQDIVDMVCRIIDDDGPRPMRDMRPAQKQRNAAEQFHSDHQGAHEMRGRQSRGLLDAVQTHNSGYPKMHNELRKRRSAGKITALPTQRATTTQEAAYSRANNCIMNKKMVQPKKLYAQPKCRSYNVKQKMRSRQAHPRIVKPKSRQVRDRNTRRTYRFTKLRMSRGCQYSTHYLAKDKQSGTGNVMQMSSFDDKMAAEEGSLQCRNVIGKSTKEYCKPDCPSHTSQSCSNDNNDKSSKHNNLDTDPSMSSYNSFASLEHEPMV